MNCLFCKNISDNSISLEHIIPESLGNIDHVLPKGTVCDTCNNYFAIKIEKELLQQPYFKNLRHTKDIKNKKGNIVAGEGIILHPNGSQVDVYRTEDGLMVDIHSSKTIDLIMNGKANQLLMPIYLGPQPNNAVVSRFLSKMAVEVLAQRLIAIEGWEDEVIFKKELDLIREYARYGKHVKMWPYFQRRIYSEDQVFFSRDIKDGKPYEILHEYTLHYSEAQELFFIVAIMGIEYAINMGVPEIATYEVLLKENSYKSFLSSDDEEML